MSNSCLQWLDRNKPDSPSVVFDLSMVKKNYVRLTSLYKDIEVFYAVKANPNKKIIRESIQVSGATLLHLHLHRFGKEQGISGVAVLAESHMSVHTWPERGYVAFDIFMCGDTNPQLAAEYLVKTFKPKKEILRKIKRGVIKVVK